MHSQDHSHSHHFDTHNRAFAIAVVLNVLFVGIEAFYGFLSGSLALIADAGHNLSDVMGLLLAWGASWLATRAATASRTYGLKKTTVMAALANALILLVAVAGITWEAIQRLANPSEVAGLTVITVAGIGVMINGITMLLFLKGQADDLNIRGAFLHMAADTAISVGVVISGGIMLWTDLSWIDPAISLLVAAVIFIGTWQLLKDSVNLAVDAVPASINPEQVRQELAGLPGIDSVHHLHIWGLSTTENALTVHLVKPDQDGDDALLAEAAHRLEQKFGIKHTTIQLERGVDTCPIPATC